MWKVLVNHVVFNVSYVSLCSVQSAFVLSAKKSNWCYWCYCCYQSKSILALLICQHAFNNGMSIVQEGVACHQFKGVNTLVGQEPYFLGV